MPSVKINSIPETPKSVTEFSKDWLIFILDDWFHKNHENLSSVEITSFNASKNNLQVCQIGNSNSNKQTLHDMTGSAEHDLHPRPQVCRQQNGGGGEEHLR